MVFFQEIVYLERKMQRMSWISMTKKWRKTLGVIICRWRYVCVLWFFWNWIYFARSIKQKSIKKNSSHTTYLETNLMILLNVDFTVEKLVRLYRFIFSSWLSKELQDNISTLKKNYFLNEIKHDDLMSEKHKRGCRNLNYFENFFWLFLLSVVVL